MSKSKSLNQEIEKVLSEKSDKSEIKFDQSMIDHMIKLNDEGLSKDDNLFGIQEKFGLQKPSYLEKHWKESGCGISKCYRGRTLDLFNSTEGKVTKKEWEDDMISGQYLKNITNYRQHYLTYYGCYHHLSKEEVLVHIKNQ